MKFNSVEVSAICRFPPLIHGLAGNVPAFGISKPARFLSNHLHDAQEFCIVAHAK
jgi:hypothetical protein